MFLNKLKSAIKSNTFLAIFFDYIISKTGLNFEKEYKIVKIIKKNSPVILDIGGHTGESISGFLKFKKKARIISFEPIAKNAEFIKKITRKNKNITIINKAINNSTLDSYIFIPYLFGYSFDSLSSLSILDLKKRIDHYFNIPFERFTIKKKLVKNEKIDNLNFNPDLIKIDTEGSEFNCLVSGKKIISTNKPIIILEYNHNNYSNIEKFLTRLNYKAFIINKKKVELLQKEKIIEIAYKKNLTNIIFLTEKYFKMINSLNF